MNKTPLRIPTGGRPVGLVTSYKGFLVSHYAHYVMRPLFKNIYNLSDIMINGGTRNNRKKK